MHILPISVAHPNRQRQRLSTKQLFLSACWNSHRGIIIPEHIFLHQLSNKHHFIEVLLQFNCRTAEWLKNIFFKRPQCEQFQIPVVNCEEYHTQRIFCLFMVSILCKWFSVCYLTSSVVSCAVDSPVSTVTIKQGLGFSASASWLCRLKLGLTHEADVN